MLAQNAQVRTLEPTAGRTLAVVAGAAVAAFLIGRALDLFWVRMITKPVPILAIVWMVRSTARDRYAKLLVAGLLAGLIGDMLLEASPRDFFVPGLAAFLVGHLFYIAAYVSDDRRLRPALGLLFLTYAAGVFLMVRPGLGKMIGPVAVYAMVIALMGWRSSARISATFRERPDQWAAFLGSLLFMFSDSLIALNRFYAPIPNVGYAIILTYWAGQLGIGLSARRP